jgi:hypothetical protein
MVICAQCGEPALAATQFCGVCGAFLNWDGENAGETAPGRTAQPQNTQPQSAQPKTAQPQTGQPDVVQPAEQRPPVRQRLPEATGTRPPAPGDLICGNCGQGNTPTRKFCSRCGSSLAEAVAVALPWWRRVFPGRKPKQHKAGTRPGKDGVRRRRGGEETRRRVGRLVRRAIAVAVLLAGLVYAAYEPFRDTVNSQALALKDTVAGIFVTRYTPVRPTKVTATAEEPGHGANLVSDNASNTYWAAPVAGAEPALLLTFDRPVDLRKVIVRVGIGDDFQSAHRPQKVHLVYSTGKTYDLTLADTPDAQDVTIENSAGATSVEMHVVALNRSLSGKDVAISEIEFFEAG